MQDDAASAYRSATADEMFFFMTVETVVPSQFPEDLRAQLAALSPIGALSDLTLSEDSSSPGETYLATSAGLDGERFFAARYWRCDGYWFVGLYDGPPRATNAVQRLESASCPN